MDKRVNKYIYKDFCNYLIIYGLGIGVYLIVGSLLKKIEIVTFITGGEVVGALILTASVLITIINSLNFLKGMSILRKEIWQGIMSLTILMSLINSLVNVLLNLCFNTVPFTYMILGEKNIIQGGTSAFIGTALIIQIIWIYILVMYRCKGSSIKWLGIFFITFVLLDRIQIFLLEYRFGVMAWSSMMIIAILLVSVINYWLMRNFEVNGEMAE